jgi:fatty acid synthase subunit beta
MLAVNTSRICPECNEASLQWLFTQIAQATGFLLEIVNYNIVDMQYICAGDIRALEVLSNICNKIKKQGIMLPIVETDTSLPPAQRSPVI